MNVVAVGGGVAAVLLLSAPLLVVGAGTPAASQACSPTYGDVEAVPATTLATAGLTESQVRHAATIIAVGSERSVPERGIVVALATALQESRLRVYANDGLGGDLAADQRGIARSLELPHEAVGTDHGSLGVFQQQWPWWGPMDELMDPASSAGYFYDALFDVPRWESLPVTVAAQAVQNSAYPDAYADDEPLARLLLADLRKGVIGFGASCVGLPYGGAVAHPLPPGSGYLDQANFAAAGGLWSSWHTGTDLSVACGTPVVAAHAGRVRVLTDQPWAGRWLVQVSTGRGMLTTWYAHMKSSHVADGQSVAPGEQIGNVGAEGNATGCHLHFEVHPQGGSIYEDPVDPTGWLAQKVGRRSA